MQSDDALAHYLRCADEHVEPIRAGEKYVTARYDLDRAFKPGDEVELRDESDETFATARVDAVTQTTVRQFAAARYAGHRGYDGLLECVENLQSYYPDAHFKPGTELTVITWSPASVEVRV